MRQFIVSAVFFLATFVVASFTVTAAFACDPQPGCVPDVVEQAAELSRIFEMQDQIADHEDQLATYRRQLASDRARLEQERRSRQSADANLQSQIDAVTAEIGRIDALEAELAAARDLIATNTASIEAMMALLTDTITPRLLALGQRVDTLERDVARTLERLDQMDVRLTGVETELNRFNFTLVGTGGYVQVGALSGGLLGAGVGVDLRLSDVGNIGLQLDLLPAGTFVSAEGTRFASSGGVNLLAGGERIRGLIGYSGGWIAAETNGSAGQWHHGNVGAEFLLGQSERWSLSPVFHAGWGASSVADHRAEGRSLGLTLTAKVRF
jgi:hypothetical protein